MGQLQYVIACAFVLFLCVQQGNCLSCYICNSHNDTNCLETPPSEKFRRDCPNSNYILCRKIKQVIDFEVNGLPAETRIIRGCGYYSKSSTNRCYQRSGFGGRQEVCACTEDFCNSSTTLLASTALALALCALLKLSH